MSALDLSIAFTVLCMSAAIFKTETFAVDRFSSFEVSVIEQKCGLKSFSIC